MIDVFVSYRTADAGYGAAGCYEFFAARFGPDRVFRDCTSVLPGEVYPEAIEKALEETRVLVALIGPDWLAAGAAGRRLVDLPEDWVRREIGRALERGILVVPVLLNEAGALVPSALPDDIRPLAYRQAARVHHRTFGSDVRRLIDQIVELVPELRRSDPTGLTPNVPPDVVSSILPPAGPNFVPSGRVRSSFRAARPPFGLLDAPIRGRDAILRQLQASVRKPDGFVGVIAAMGGVGKTTVALELCRRVEAHGYRVWWINAVDPMEISSEMLEIARQVGAAQGDIDDARAGRRSAGDLVWASLNSASKWLLVFDNADDPSVLGGNRRLMAEGKGWARPAQAGLTLVTSRRGDVAIWGAAARVHHLGVLTAAEGAQVLLDLAPNAGSVQEAVNLADRLGGLPLALHLAGSYINDDLTAIRTFAAYRHELDVRFRDLMSAADVEGVEASRRRAAAWSDDR